MSSDLACTTVRKVFLASIFGVGVFLIPNGVQSATDNSATLQWAANQESDLAGYRVYHGTTSGNYGSSRNVGKTTTYEYTNLESNKTHYFSLTAYDTSGNESSPSSEVFKYIQGTPPPEPEPEPDPNPNPNPDPSPNPTFPMLVNFQPSSSEVPVKFLKDAGEVFDSSRGYGWDVSMKGVERRARVDQTIDTFVQTSNTAQVTWNCAVPNGTYYISMVIGDPKKSQGPHTLNVEGNNLVTGIKSGKGQYLTLLEYPVDVKDNTLSITLGGGGKGTTLLNFAIINSSPSTAQSLTALAETNLSPTMQVLSKSLGTDLIAKVVNSGTVTKVHPQQLVNQEKKVQKQLAKAEKKRQKLMVKYQKQLAKIQLALTKIEEKLVKYAHNSKVVAKLNKKKEKYSLVLAKIQEKYSLL